MRHVSVVCPKCKDLVPVVDKTIQVHGDCPAGGMRYVPSLRGFKAGPGGPSFELLATKRVSMTCSDCNVEHKGIAALFKVNMPDPTVN